MTKVKIIFDEIRYYLMGKKTYIVSVFLATYEVLLAFNAITVSPEQNVAILALLGSLFGVTLSAKINRSTN